MADFFNRVIHPRYDPPKIRKITAARFEKYENCALIWSQSRDLARKIAQTHRLNRGILQDLSFIGYIQRVGARKKGFGKKIWKCDVFDGKYDSIFFPLCCGEVELDANMVLHENILKLSYTVAGYTKVFEL